MLVPFQRLLYCCQEQGIILAASGHQIFSFHASDGRLLSKWVHAKPSQAPILATSTSNQPSSAPEAAEPPEKRQKTTDNDLSDASSADIVTENGKKRRRRPKPKVSIYPSVINLCGTKNGQHVIAVTGEDKRIHVLQLLKDGRLEQQSERTMPKRPSAIALTNDEQTILCADKFGDVYSLPLLPSAAELNVSEPNLSSSVNGEDEKVRKPAANSFTVHSKKNRETLRNQEKAASSQKRPEKKKIGFAHQLLLGHVSLLTDIASVSLQTRHCQKEYIVTADRDEHIRISRGLPQAHIIERFCLGHTQFVSKLCFPAWRPEVLVSGGGDDYLICWDWTTGVIKQRIDIRSEYERVRNKVCDQGEPSHDQTSPPIAVSGIWVIETGSGSGSVIVACEHFPALLTFSLGASGNFVAAQTIEFDHNVLDVAVDTRNRTLISSLDTVHAPCTQSLVQGDRDNRMVVVRQMGDAVLKDGSELLAAQQMNEWAQNQSKDDDADRRWLADLYYGIEHLRKQNQEE